MKVRRRSAVSGLRTIRVPLLRSEYDRLMLLAEVMHGDAGAWIEVTAAGTLLDGLYERERLFRDRLFRAKASRWFHRKAAA